MLLKTTDSDSNLLFSNVQGESIPFVIGDSSVIIDIIRKKIYSYPIRTLVQEYLSNAKDSCLEAGKLSSDIQVTLPTSLLPEFTIRDFGVGMSDERIREVFVQYGISTKRQSTSQLGYFGIGSKSGWAYTDSFIVESYHQNKHRRYIADIGDNKEGRLLLFSEVETDEPNGVLIKIPVSANDIKHFNDSFIRATCFWKNKPKLLYQQISYPTEIFHLEDDITFYKIERAYGSEHNKLTSTVYFNANGIPFEVKDHNNTQTLSKLFQFCSEQSILMAIKVDPAKLGISANRESFSEQKYADSKLERTYNKIYKYLQNQFDIVEPALYPAVYLKLDFLIHFENDFFKNKTYFFEKRWGSVSVTIKKGHLSRIEYGIKYHKSIERRVEMLNDKGEPHKINIYLSRSKGVLFTPAKGPIRTPRDIEPPTQKALIIAKRVQIEEKMKNNIREKSYVFFRENMSDEEYFETAAVLGATQYVEDSYKEVKLKFQRPDKKPKKDKEVITVRKFTIGIKRDTNAIRSNTFMDINEDNINYYDCIFYGERCSLMFYKLVNYCIPRFCVVYGSPTTLQKLADLKNPKILPIESFSDFVNSNPEIMQHYIDHWAYHKNKNLWAFLLRIKKALVSEKIDIPELFKRTFIYSNVGIQIDPHSMIKNLPKTSVLYDFLNTYPLLTRLSDYPPLGDNLYPHISFYMQSIDKGLIP